MKKEEIELPRRGYDTKDVEAMSHAVESSVGHSGWKSFVLVVLLAVAGVVIWLIAGR